MNLPANEGPRRFPIRLGPKSRPVLLLFGVRPGNAWVDLSPTEIDANFGFFHLRVSISDVESWRIEGPWLWITAIGMRRGIRHGDISFDGNHTAGVRLDFKVPIRRGLLRIPRFYVSVADVEGFGAALAAAGIPGEDARRAQ